ncbi:MAG: hypothetical protein VB144_07190 [Clostridia bacterium]|nr:hypothetical protein [Clostridia bacterium]
MLLRTIGPVPNYRRRPVAFPGGIMVILGAVGGPVALAVFGAVIAGMPFLANAVGANWRQSEGTASAGYAACRLGAYLALSLGFGLAGFVDDMLGDHDHSGFAGHMGALKQRIVTTGALKVILGGLVATGAVAVMGGRGVRLLLDAAVVALAANFVNLLDRRPGRAAKGFLAGCGIAVALSGALLGPGAIARILDPASGALGAAIAFAPMDLGERAMLGDTGANSLGAALGFVILGLPASWRTLALAALIWLTATSESRSYGEIIEGIPILRFLDRLGRGNF